MQAPLRVTVTIFITDGEDTFGEIKTHLEYGIVPNENAILQAMNSALKEVPYPENFRLCNRTELYNCMMYDKGYGIYHECPDGEEWEPIETDKFKKATAHILNQAALSTDDSLVDIANEALLDIGFVAEWSDNDQKSIIIKEHLNDTI